MTQQVAVQTGLGVVGGVLGTGVTAQLGTQALSALATGAVILPFSRSQESEADHLGLIYMAKAGYQPSAARDLWVRMDAASKGQQQPEFLSTHPSATTRITQIEGWIPEALTYYKPR
jgi:predicted Zn-dependent protease